MSAVANFVGALTGTAVAKTVGSGLIDTNVESQTVIAAALIGAIVWNLLTWRLGIPSSSSHALIGGLLGAALVVGRHRLVADGRRRRQGARARSSASPLIGFTVGLLLMALIFNVFRRAHPRTAERGLPAAAGASPPAYMAFSHGSNDAQKTMGIMTLALVTAGVIDHVRSCRCG